VISTTLVAPVVSKATAYTKYVSSDVGSIPTGSKEFSEVGATYKGSPQERVLFPTTVREIPK